MSEFCATECSEDSDSSTLPFSLFRELFFLLRVFEAVLGLGLVLDLETLTYKTSRNYKESPKLVAYE